jgi:hypothetical protein
LKISTGDPMTRPSSEPYCRKRRPPPNNCFERQTSTSPLTSGPRTSSEEQNLHHRRHGATRTSNPTGAGRRGPVRRYTSPNHPSLEPEVRPAEANRHWMTSSTPSAHTTRTCATPYETTGTSSTLSDTADRSSLYHLLPRGGPSKPKQPQQPEGGGGGAFPCIDREVNVIFGGHGSQENRRQ